MGPGGAGPCTELSVVPGRPMGPGLGQSRGLGLESVPRLATSGRPVWSGGLGTVGSPAAVGAAATASTAVGARGELDVEPHRQWLGILEQRGVDPDLTARGLSPE